MSSPDSKPVHLCTLCQKPEKDDLIVTAMAMLRLGKDKAKVQLELADKDAKLKHVTGMFDAVVAENARLRAENEYFARENMRLKSANKDLTFYWDFRK